MHIEGHTAERRSTAREDGRVLSAAAQERLDQEGQALKHAIDHIEKQEIEVYRQARVFKEIYDRGVWHDWLPEGTKPSRKAFCEFAAAYAGDKKAKTVARLLDVVCFYSEERYRALLEEGVCPSALAYVAQADDDIQQELLALARKGYTVEELSKAGQVARRVRAQLSQAKGTQGAELLPFLMEKAALEEKLRKKQEELRRQKKAKKAQQRAQQKARLVGPVESRG
jgi:hypothetical protein